MKLWLKSAPLVIIRDNRKVILASAEKRALWQKICCLKRGVEMHSSIPQPAPRLLLQKSLPWTNKPALEDVSDTPVPLKWPQVPTCG